MEEGDWGWEGIKKNPNGFGYIRVTTENGKIEDAKEEENSLVEIRLTPSLHRFRMYLNDWLAGEPVEESEIEELKMLMAPEERDSFLLVLSAFLAGEDVSGAIQVENNVETYSNKIKEKDLYTQLVQDLELIKLVEEPKEEDDTIGDSKNLTEFCEKIKELGEEREVYKREWIEKLLSFSVEEILETPEGNAVAEKLLIGADCDLIVEFIKKINEVQKLLDPQEKVLVLKVITEQPRTNKEEMGKLIQEWFADGINKKLLLDPEELMSDLKNISLKFCTIESLVDAQKVAEYEEEVVRMCLQDPFTSLYQLMTKSINVEVFRVLIFARPFYNLKFVPRKEPKEREIGLPELSEALIVHCFSKLLKYIPDYPDSCYDALDKAIGKLVSENILSQSDIFCVLKYRMLKFIGAKNQVPLSLVQGYAVLIENLVKHKNITDTNLISEIVQFVVNMNRLLSLFTNSTTINYAPQIREKFREIMDHLEVPFGQVTTEMQEDIEDCSIFDQGIMYVRFQELRPLIKSLIVGKNSPQNLMSFREFLPVCALPWVLNCTEMEWEPLAEFLFDVAMSPDSNLIRVKSYGKINLLNEMLIFMYACCMDKGSLQPFGHVQRFFVKAVEKIELKDESEWHDLFNNLLIIGGELSKSSKRCRRKKGKIDDEGESKEGLEQNEKAVSLYILLSYLIGKLDEFEKSGRSLPSYEVLKSELKRFHEVNANCEPLRWLVSEKLDKLENKLCEA